MEDGSMRTSELSPAIFLKLLLYGSFTGICPLSILKLYLAQSNS